MNWLEVDESMVTSPPRTDPVPATVSGQRAPPVVVDGDAELPQALDQWPQRPLPRARIAVERNGSGGQ